MNHSYEEKYCASIEMTHTNSFRIHYSFLKTTLNSEIFGKIFKPMTAELDE